MQALVVLQSGCCNIIVIHHTPVAISSTPDSKLQYAYAVPTARGCTVHTRSVGLSALAQPSPTVPRCLYCTVLWFADVRTYLGHWRRVPNAAARCWAAQFGYLFMLCNVKSPELYVGKSYDF